MKLKYKIFITLSLILIPTFGVLEYLHYQSEKKHVFAHLRQDARNIRSILMSTHHVFLKQFIKSGVSLNEKTIGFLPVNAMSRISSDFKIWNDYPITFKNASDRPRNPNNRADSLEMEAIKLYRQNRDINESFLPYKSSEGEDYFHFSSPIRVEMYCLKCHGRREDAPQMIQDNYSTAFDYKVGELSGIMSIRLPSSKINAMVWDQFKLSALIHLLSFLTLFVSLTWLISRYIATPLEILKKGLNRIGSGDYGQSMENLPYEMNTISQSYDDMASELDSRESDLRIQNQRREALNTILHIAQQDNSLNEQLNSILKVIFSSTRLSVLEKGGVFLIDQRSGKLMLTVHKGFSPEIQAACTSVLPEKCLCGRVAEMGEVIFSDSLDDRHGITCDSIEQHGHYCIPIKQGDNVLGTINLYVSEGHRRDRGEEEFLMAVANTMASTINRKSAEKVRGWLLHTIEQVKELIMITDVDGTIQYVNPTFTEVTGYTRDEVIGQNPRILKSGKQDEAFYREMWKVLTRGETWHGRIVNKKKDGSCYHEEATISPVCDDQGIPVNYVAIKRDITEDIILEMEYHQTRKVESIGRLAGGVAHDLNNLLTPILGYSEILLHDTDLGDGRKESVDQILRAGFKARDLVRQLLAFSRKQILEYRPLDMNEVVAGFELLLRRTIREDIVIKLVLSPDKCSIMADIGQIEQVIMNLSVNAQDAMPKGGYLTIETAVTELDTTYADKHEGVESGTYVRLAISDTGAGMDESTRSHIFEPFFTTKGSMGTGLGLSTVYGIVKQHSGNIWVYSELDKGTTFKLYLPLSRESNIEMNNSSDTESSTKGSETILLVEDSEQVRNLAHAILTERGYKVLAAENGLDALKVMATHNGLVHLLLTDVIMPGMNGQELFSRANARQPGLKVIYMSGYTDDMIAHHGVMDKNTAFIQKPFTVQVLANKVREVLENN